MSSVIVEIRAGEGGDDAKQLVREQLAVYAAFLARHNLTAEILEDTESRVVAQFSGENVLELFAHEDGGHRWQRVPPNERRGRVHTSTVTVAVMRVPEQSELQVNNFDLEWKFTTGQGPGGQARNKTQSCVILKHRPTGTQVRCDTARSQHQNKSYALEMLRAKLLQDREMSSTSAENEARRQKIGSGMRGDKVRTVRVQDGIVKDAKTNRKIPLRQYLSGDFDGLFEEEEE